MNYYSGKIRTAHVLAPVQPNCTFSAPVSFRRSHGKGVVPITVKVHFQGNGYLAGAKKVDHVKVGHQEVGPSRSVRRGRQRDRPRRDAAHRISLRAR